jgi:hypothetical protein
VHLERGEAAWICASDRDVLACSNAKGAQLFFVTVGNVGRGADEPDGPPRL